MPISSEASKEERSETIRKEYTQGSGSARPIYDGDDIVRTPRKLGAVYV